MSAALTNWRFDRVADVDKAVLRLGAFELMHEPQTPAAVVIDEAVELAKRFSEADSPAFVNGVLDALRQEGAMSEEPQGGSRPRTSHPSRAGPRNRRRAWRRCGPFAALGVNPYPNRFARSHLSREIHAAHGAKSAEELEAEGARGAGGGAGDC